MQLRVVWSWIPFGFFGIVSAIPTTGMLIPGAEFVAGGVLIVFFGLAALRRVEQCKARRNYGVEALENYLVLRAITLSASMDNVAISKKRAWRGRDGRRRQGDDKTIAGGAAGGMASPAVGHAVRGMERKRRADPNLARLLEKMERQCVVIATPKVT
jgi:hypothetical protein